MPFLHFYSGNEGYVKACCVSSITYGNINTQSLEEIWNGEKVEKLREAFINGNSDPRCAVCINMESAGGKSIRQETFERFPDFKIEKGTLPKYFDIRFSNVCNFSCRTCWHGASSSWFKDAEHIGNRASSKAVIQNIKNLEDFLSKTGDALLKSEEIYFAGGEPLVTQEHYQLLEFLLENNHTNLKLRYNTNLSHLTFKNWNILELWTHFESIEVLMSIDGSDQLGEYVRKGLNWKKFISNAKEINKKANIKTMISPTVSIFNILHLAELYDTCLQEGIIQSEDFYLNILERPYHYNIQCIPKDIKKKITSFLLQYKGPIENQISDCLQYMNDKDRSEKYWSKFVSETALLDKIRKEHIPIDLQSFDSLSYSAK